MNTNQANYDNKSFEINCKDTKAFEGEDGAYYVKGIANTGNKDLYNDKLTVDALQSIADQMTTHNLHLDHDRSFEGILGPLVEGNVEDDGLHYKARILDEKKDFIKSLLDQGVNIGSSINGIAQRPENDYINIVDWVLTEVSLTPIPADQGTMATVQSSKSFDEIIKQCMEEKNMADEETITKDEIIELINTAFNEKQDELVELVRSQLVAEYEDTINELTSRIETLEGELENAGEGGGEGGGEEGKAGNTEENEEGGEGGEGGNTEENEEENEKRINDLVSKRVDEQMKSLLQPLFKDNKKHVEEPEEKEEKKSYTPRELAEMLSN